MNLQDESDCIESNLPLEKQFEESPVNTVVTTVAEVTKRSPLELEPLCEVIDPDALNELFGGSRDGSSSLSVTFEYCGQAVTLTADRVRVASPAAAGD